MRNLPSVNTPKHTHFYLPFISLLLSKKSRLYKANTDKAFSLESTGKALNLKGGEDNNAVSTRLPARG